MADTVTVMRASFLLLRILFLVFVAVSLWGSVRAPYAHAYDVETHAYLTSETIDFYNTHFPDRNISGVLKERLVDGSQREDNVPRFMNHFYDPVHDRGLTYDPAIDPLIPVGTWQKSKEWAQDELSQKSAVFETSAAASSLFGIPQKGKTGGLYAETNFTWQSAMRHYLKGDKEEAMFALGHVIHLIQDASVPAHTRNDPHPPTDNGGSPYENWTSKFTPENPDTHMTERMNSKHPVLFDNLDSYFDALAQYSNNYFYSADTIGIQSGYELPQPEYTEKEGDYTFGFREDRRGRYKLFLRKHPGFLGMIFSLRDDSVLFLAKEGGDAVLADYWSRLSSESIRHGAGVIALFFREVERISQAPDLLSEEPRSFFEKASGIVRSTLDVVRMTLVSMFGKDSTTPVEVALEKNVVETTSPNSDNTRENVVDKEGTIVSQPQVQRKVKESALGAPNDGLFAVARVIDGDTIVLETGEHVRYLGIDADETGSNPTRAACLAQRAKQRNKELVLEKRVRLERGAEDTDTFGRLLRYVWLGDTLVNEALIREGYVRAFGFGNSHPREAVFIRAEELARETRVGLWGDACRDTQSKEKNNIGNEEDEIRVSQPTSPTKILINEVRLQGGEFVELYNPASTEVKLEGYIFAYYSALRTDWKEPWRKKFFPEGAVIPADGYFVVALGDYAGTANWRPYASVQLGNRAGTVAVLFGDFSEGNVEVVDAVGWGEVTLVESVPITTPTSDEVLARSMEGRDSDNNRNDFVLTTIATPGRPNSIYGSHGASGGGSAGGGSEEESSSSDSAPPGEDASVDNEKTDEQENDTGDSGDSEKSDTSPPESSSTVPESTQIVISEVLFDAEEGDVGKEFVELYNPSGASADIDDWTLSYTKESSTTTIVLARPGSKGEDITVVPEKGFFLFGLNGYDEALWDGLRADVRRSISLPNGAVGDSPLRITVILSDKNGNEVDRVSYNKTTIPASGSSIERRALSGTCISAADEGEFLGNGCDTDIDGDFDVRTLPRPQNSESLPEPRPAPSVKEFSAEYVRSSTTLEVAFVWDASGGSEGIPVSMYFIYDITEGDSPKEYFKSAGGKSVRIPLREVGRDYVFELRAEDRDGLSGSATTTISVPGFLENIRIYQDTREESQEQYLVDVFYPSYPFIPHLWSEPTDRKWQGMLLYLNHLPNLSNDYLQEGTFWVPGDTEGVVGANTETSPSAIFGLHPEVSDRKSFSALREKSFLLPEEDLHFTLALSSTTRDLALAGGDYFTVAYYDRERAVGERGAERLRLVAADHTKYFFRNDTSFQEPPIPPGGMSISFDPFGMRLSLSWATSTDPDSPDTSITYETQVSPSSLRGSEWESAARFPETERGRAVHDVAPSHTYIVAVRAKDEFGNTSEPTVLEWSFPEGFSPYELSRAFNSAHQDFRVEREGNLGSIDIFLANASLPGPIPENFVCFLDIYEFTSLGPKLVASNDLPHEERGVTYQNRGFDCDGVPVTFTYKDTSLFLSPSKAYRWAFRFVQTNANPTVRAYGRNTALSGGEFSTKDFLEAAFTVRGKNGEVLVGTE